MVKVMSHLGTRTLLLIKDRPFLANITLYILLFLLIWETINIYFAAIIISLPIVYSILNSYLSNGVFNTKIFRYFITIIFYISFLQSVVLVSWLLSHEFPLNTTPLLGLLILCIVYFYQLLFKSSRVALLQKSHLPFFKISDILSIGVSIFFVSFVIVIPTLRIDGFHKNSFVMAIDDGVDDAAHLGLLNDRLQFNRGVLQGTSIVNNTRLEGASFYPAGWHAANAAVMLAVKPNIQAGTQSLRFYVISKLFWYTVLLFVFVRSIFTVYAVLTKKRLSVPVGIWFVLSSLLFCYLFLLHPFRAGYYSFLPQLIVAPVFVLTLIQMVQSKPKSILFQKSLPFAVMMLVGGTLSWLLVLPVFALTIILSMIDRIIIIKLKSFLIEFYKGLIRYLPLYILMVCAVLAQLYTSSASTVSVSFINGILMPGGIAIYNPLFYGFILLGIGLATLLIKKEATVIIKSIFNYLLVSLLFAGVIFSIQLYMLQENLYYYYKTLDTFTIVAIVLSLVGFGYFINWISEHRNKSLAVIFAVLLPLSALLFIPSDNSNASYIKGERYVSPLVSRSVYSELLLKDTQLNYNKMDYVLYYIKGDERQNDIATMLVKSNKPENGCLMRLRLLMKATPVDQFNAKDLKQYQNICVTESTHVTYIVNIEMLTNFQTQIKAENLTNFIQVRSL